MSWLLCTNEMNGGKKVVSQLKCTVCIDFADRNHLSKNFSDKWIVGANSVRISNICDHTQSDQHSHAMLLLRKQQAKSAALPPPSYAPIAQALNKLMDNEREKLPNKLDIAHFVATQRLPFTLYPQICELEVLH